MIGAACDWLAAVALVQLIGAQLKSSISDCHSRIRSLIAAARGCFCCRCCYCCLAVVKVFLHLPYDLTIWSGKCFPFIILKMEKKFKVVVFYMVLVLRSRSMLGIWIIERGRGEYISAFLLFKINIPFVVILLNLCGFVLIILFSE